jgi:hypothetical protein
VAASELAAFWAAVAAYAAAFLGAVFGLVLRRPGLVRAGLAAGAVDRKSTRLNSSHNSESRMPSSA